MTKGRSDEIMTHNTNTELHVPEHVNHDAQHNNHNDHNKPNVFDAPPIGVHYKHKRRFHDAWAFAAWFISIATIIGFGIYNIISLVAVIKESGGIDLWISSGTPRHLLSVCLMNIGIVLGVNILTVIVFAFIPKQVIIGGFICGPAIALGWMIYGIVKGFNGYATAINASAFVFALIGSGIGYFVLRNMIDSIAVLLKVGGRILLRNILTVLASYFVFLVISAVMGGMIICGFTMKGSSSTVISSLIAFFFSWCSIFFTYLFDIFTAGMVTGTVIKNTPRDQEERNMNVSGCAVINTLWAMGTASIASLVMGLLNTLKQSVSGDAYSILNEGLGMLIIRFILRMLVSFVEQLVEAVNKFALCYTAITGEGFVNSIKGSWGCIKDGGFVALGSYYAVEYAVYFINFLASLIIMASNYGYYRLFMEYEIVSIFLVMLDALMSVVIIITFTRIISSASNSLAFIFVLDRERIRQYNEELYKELYKLAVKEEEKKEKE